MFKNDMDNSLTISGTISLDTGKYTCMACTDGLDCDEMSAQLTVQGQYNRKMDKKWGFFIQNENFSLKFAEFQQICVENYLFEKK